MQWCPFWTLWPCSVLASWCWWRPPRAAWAWTRRPWAAGRRQRRGGRAWCRRSWRRTWATWRSGWSLWRKKLSNFTQVVYSIIKHIFSSSWYWCCWWFCFWCWCFLLVVGGWCPWKYIGEALFGDSDTEKSTLKEVTWQGRWIYKKKHHKNCECCPGHYLIVNHYSSMNVMVQVSQYVNNSQLCHLVTKSLSI